MVEVIATDEFKGWFEDLNEQDSAAVIRVVDMLETMGVTLPFPYSSKINGAKCAMRELRIQSGGRPLRVFYVFDPKKNAVLLIAGDKTGNARFYEQMVPKADEIFEQYLAEQAEEEKDRK